VGELDDEEVTGGAVKKVVLAKHEAVHRREIVAAREMAIDILLSNGNSPIIADDVRDVYDEVQEIDGLSDWGNWAGSLFRSGSFAPVGFRETTRQSNHSRMVRTWVLKGL
jgi:hypothetical protein